MRDDYCSGVPEKFQGVKVGQTCCRAHDNAVGQAGRYNPITPHIDFFKCLKKSGIGLWLVIILTIGGALFTWWKQPYLWYKKWNYRNQENWDGIIK